MPDELPDEKYDEIDEETLHIWDLQSDFYDSVIEKF